MIHFDPGHIYITPGAMDALTRAIQLPSEFILRHLNLEQGELDNGDNRQNTAAMKNGFRIFSSFKTTQGDPLWVISEAVDMENGGNVAEGCAPRSGKPKIRETTTLLTPGDVAVHSVRSVFPEIHGTG